MTSVRLAAYRMRFERAYFRPKRPRTTPGRAWLGLDARAWASDITSPSPSPQTGLQAQGLGLGLGLRYKQWLRCYSGLGFGPALWASQVPSPGPGPANVNAVRIPSHTHYTSLNSIMEDWKKHKLNCKTTTAVASVPQVGTARQLNELLRIRAQHNIHQETTALGLDPSLITGAKYMPSFNRRPLIVLMSSSSGADFFQVNDDSGNFWRLESQIRERWEAKVQAHNVKSKRFWMDYLSLITSAFCLHPPSSVC
ncbi:hypothetical protein C8J57DRAFT_1234899 [Mycena rebaudengoi]|nr:hypothetical protein C8J57DRAFT_1234899 [Mycena rebaudengoi]